MVSEDEHRSATQLEVGVVAVRLELVAAQVDGENHALPPGANRGLALCGLAEGESGWHRAGHTNRLYPIDCHGCREGAADVLGSLGELGSVAGVGTVRPGWVAGTVAGAEQLGGWLDPAGR